MFRYPIALWSGGEEIDLKRVIKVFYYEIKRILLRKPYVAEIFITEKCNLKCKHCFFFKTNRKYTIEDQDAENWTKNFENLYHEGVRRLCIVGGEPSLNMDVIFQANAVFPYIDICTNGLIKIPESINHRLFISVDGSDDYNYVYRGAKVLHRISENYKNDKRVVLLMTLTKFNINEIESVVDFARINGFRALVFSLYTPLSEKDEFYIDQKTRFELIAKIRDCKKKYPDIIKASDFVLDWYRSQDHTSKCYWRDKVLHYNSKFELIDACSNMDCENCGYFSGANIGPLNIFYKK
ncbi:MAG: radical SAM protein [Bacteroidales bacterium]|nr:radical SAM protein [Bacteroidales bacterium]